MHDRNDIKFKGSLGSPPKIKWQLFSWGPGTLPLLPTLSSHSLTSILSLALQGHFPSPGGREGVRPQQVRVQVETLKYQGRPQGQEPPVVSTQCCQRGSNPAPSPLGSNHGPTKGRLSGAAPPRLLSFPARVIAHKEDAQHRGASSGSISRWC